MSGDLILGIDGGGSKVLLALADRQGRIRRMAKGGGVNPMDDPNWLSILNAQISPFTTEPGLKGIAAALPVYGEVEHISQSQRQVLAAAFKQVPQLVLNDVDAAHLGAFACGPGILLLAGTGSMAWAREPNGISHRVGGWGDTIGDEGSGYWIGRRALGLVSQSLDGRAPFTTLVDAVFSHLGLERSKPLDALEGWVSALPSPRAAIATLAVVVDQEARHHDTAATALLEQAADELARHVTAVARHLDHEVQWSYAGGVFSSELLLKAVTRRIGRPPTLPCLPPVGGALLAAARHLGWPIEPAFIEQLAAAMQGAGSAAQEKEPAALGEQGHA